MNYVLETNITRDLTQPSGRKEINALLFPLVGPSLIATERKSNAKETGALIYSIRTVENYLSKILDKELRFKMKKNTQFCSSFGRVSRRFKILQFEMWSLIEGKRQSREKVRQDHQTQLKNMPCPLQISFALIF